MRTSVHMSRVFHFGLFAMDLATGELTKRGVPVRVENQPLKILTVLVENPGRVVSREDLRKRLWATGTFVGFDKSLNTAIKKLRQVLGDSADNPCFIETVPRRGYRFIAPLHPAYLPVETESGSTGPSPTLTGPLDHPESADRLGPKLLMAELSGFSTAFAKRLVRSGLWVGIVIAFSALCLLRFFVLSSHGQSKSSEPEFRRLSFGRGMVRSARFTPDHQSVLYSAAWDGKPSELFLARSGSAESRPLGIAGDLLAISRSGEMALLLNPKFGSVSARGTLAVLPFTGSAPRKLLEEVQDADWSPDGSALVITHYFGDHCALEFPAGKIRYQTTGGAWISNPRISPQGDRIAFVEHPLAEDSAGYLSVLDLHGVKKIVSRKFDDVSGLAWDSEGGAIWFSAYEIGFGGGRAVFKIAKDGKLGLIRRESGGLTVQDVSQDGLLLTRENGRGEVFGRIYPEENARDLGWLDNAIGTDLSPDGSTLLLAVEGEAAGRGYDIYLRKTDGSPATRLGEGFPTGISPDGKSVIAVYPWGLQPSAPPQVMRLPVGAGEPAILTHDSISHYWATWLPEGTHLLHEGNEPGHERRSWIQSVSGGNPKAVTPEGVTGCRVSPDGKLLAAVDSTDRLWIYPLQGGSPELISAVRPGEFPIQWTQDSKSLFVASSSLPAEVYRVKIATGDRKLLYRLMPADAAGVSTISPILLTPDGKSYVYSYYRSFSDLYAVNGLAGTGNQR